MPRRPRSTFGDARRSQLPSHRAASPKSSPNVRREPTIDPDSDDRGAGPSSLQHRSEDEGSEEENSDGGSDVNVDAPRVALWQDEDEMDDSDRNDTSEDDELLQKSAQNGLHTLPLGVLAKAHRALVDAAVQSDSDEVDSDATGGDGNENDNTLQNVKPQSDHKKPLKKPNVKRSSKHAPQEISSKRPVSRRRQVVEVQKIEPRDPRFLPMTGAFDSAKFRSQYDFLSEMHKEELSTLRDNLKRARKMLSSSPRDLRAEREREVERLERAFKRAESSVSRDKRELIEHEALERVSREEKLKRKEGKSAFYLKSSEKKKLFLKARYDAMAAEGGKRAVQKAMQKKQKKIGQKETKSRPFARNSDTATGLESRKRVHDRSDGGFSLSKRRKVA